MRTPLLDFWLRRRPLPFESLASYLPYFNNSDEFNTLILADGSEFAGERSGSVVRLRRDDAVVAAVQQARPAWFGTADAELWNSGCGFPASREAQHGSETRT